MRGREIERELVGGEDVVLFGYRQAFGLGGGAGGQECVVVEHEDRHHRRRPARARPDRILMLRGQDTEFIADLHQMVIAGTTEDLNRILAGGPQFVIPRHPDHRFEARAQQLQGPSDVVGAFGDVPCNDQPVLRCRRIQRFGHRTIGGLPGVQVADRPKGGRHNR